VRCNEVPPAECREQQDTEGMCGQLLCDLLQLSRRVGQPKGVGRGLLLLLLLLLQEGR